MILNTDIFFQLMAATVQWKTGKLCNFSKNSITETVAQ